MSNQAIRPDLDHWAINMAQVVATRGTCLRRAVGCVLLNKAGHVLATGVNGVAAGRPHCNQRHADPEMGGGRSYLGRARRLAAQPQPEFPYACPGAHAASGTELDACEAIHAEQNALLQCQDVARIHTCYVTVSPCVTCTKLLMNTGCERIVFLERYPQPAAERLWLQAGRAWLQLGS